MTYGLFLLIFLVLPIIFLAIALRRQLTRAQLLSGAIICAISFVYTTPWDNYAAFKKLWKFAPEFVWGPPLWFGCLPLEEYLFYFAEAIFVCLVVVGLSRIPGLTASPLPPAPSPSEGRGGVNTEEMKSPLAPPLPSEGEGAGGRGLATPERKPE